MPNVENGKEIYIHPRAAVRKLREASRGNQTVYICGRAGIGKTTLLNKFLNKDKHHYFSASELHHQSLRIEEGGKTGIVVIDDLQLANEGSVYEELLPEIAELSKRHDIWLILSARCEIPTWLKPLYIQNIFTILEEKDLILSLEEQKKYFDLWEICFKEHTLEKINKISQGCPLFLRMAAIELAAGTKEEDVVNRASDHFWDYLEYHVYEQWDVQLQEFVAELSIVDRFHIRLAEMITGRNDVEYMLQKLRETDSFLREQDGNYEFSYFVKKSMRRRLRRKYNSEKMNRLYYNAGLCYELEGNIPEALKMYESCKDSERIFNLLIANARKNPASGHYYELRRYYLSLPEEYIQSSAELMVGMSMLQSMLLNQEESERWYGMLKEHAKLLRGKEKKEAESRLLLLDITLPHRGSVNLIELLKNAGNLILNRKAFLPEMSVTSNLPSMMNGGKDFCEWSRHDTELANSIGKIVEFVLGRYGKGLVKLALAESFFEKGGDSYEIAALASQGKMQAEAGGKIEQCFVAVGILTWLRMMNGHADDALELLDDFENKASLDARQLLPNIAALRCRILLYQGETAEILEWMNEAPNENTEFCTMERLRYMTKIRIYIQYGKYDLAVGLLNQIFYYANIMKRIYIQMEAQLLLAIVQFRMNKKDWKTALQKCITQAENYHFVRLVSREGAAVWELLKTNPLKWEDDAFRAQVMKETETMAVTYPAYLRKRMDGDVVLSENALKVLRLQAEGMSAEQIAETLGISKSTVKYHNKETYRKLGVTGKAAAVIEARKRRII